MAVPKQRHNRSRTRRRRGGHKKLAKTSVVKCSACSKPITPHTVCRYCGSYKGKEYIDVTKSITTASKKKK